MADPAPYPEHEKLRAMKDEIFAIVEFLLWLKERKRYVLFDRDNRELVCIPTERLAAEFYDLDMEEFENEKVRMLEEIRLMNKKPPQ